MFRYYLSGLKNVFSVAKKVFLVVAIFFIVISLFFHFIKKDQASLAPQIDPIKQNREEIYKVINDKKLTSTKEGKILVNLYRNTMCSMIGEACTNIPSDADNNYKKSIFGSITKLLIIPYTNPPASGLAWAQSGLESAGFIPKTMAAEGIGFTVIKPFADIWKIFRDLAYMLLVIILIAIGFMIMFRMKMNPQTVISVENALPKIVISLILITFSFAIAGFMIDVMFIIIGIIVSILIKDPSQATQFKNEYMMANSWDLIRDIRMRFGTQSIGAVLGSAFTQIVPLPIYLALRTAGGVIFIFLMKWFIEFISKDGGDLFGLANTSIGAATAVLGIGNVLQSIVSIPFFGVVLLLFFLFGFIFVIPWLVSLLIGFSILFLFFRIFFILFTSYLKLIINIILSPLLLLFEAVPGKNTFKYWFMNILGCLIPFPIIIFVFLLSYIIIFNTDPSGMTARLPYLYGIDSNSFRILIGMGIIFLIPDFIKTAKEVLGIKELPFNIGVGTFFGGVTAGVGGATGLLGQFGSLALAINYLPGGRNLLNKIAGDKAGTDLNPHVRPLVGGGSETGQTTR